MKNNKEINIEGLEFVKDIYLSCDFDFWEDNIPVWKELLESWELLSINQELCYLWAKSYKNKNGEFVIIPVEEDEMNFICSELYVNPSTFYANKTEGIYTTLNWEIIKWFKKRYSMDKDKWIKIL